MKLAEWLAKEGKDATDLAREIGVNVASITRLIPRAGKKQTRRPGWDLIDKIAAATNGAVTANDFMDDHDKPLNNAQASSVPSKDGQENVAA